MRSSKSPQGTMFFVDDSVVAVAVCRESRVRVEESMGEVCSGDRI